MKLARWLVCAAMLFSLCTHVLALEYGSDINPNETVYTQKFEDIPVSNWAFQYISGLVERGAINGYPDGKFYPDHTVTREQFAKIMVMAAGVTPQPVDHEEYSDIPTARWSAPYISAASKYMTAYQQSDGKYAFRPENPALREDIAVAVVKLKGYDISLADVGALQVMFSDYASISASIRPYIAAAVEHGIISGYPDGTFRGQNTVTRSEAAAILWRAFQYGNEDKVVIDDVTGPEDKPNGTNTSEKSEAPEESSVPQMEESEPINTVETIGAIPAAADDFVFTKSGDIYYLKDNELFRASEGETTELFDGNSDYYEEITVADMVARLKDGPEDYYWSGIDTYQEGENYDLLYFDTMVLSDIAYDQKNDMVYVYGETNHQYGLVAYYSHKIFDVENLTVPIYQVFYGDMGATILREGEMICNNGTLIYTANRTGSLKVNPSTGTATAYADVYEHELYRNYLQAGNSLIEIGINGCRKYDLVSGTWKSVNLADNGVTSATAYCVYQNLIHYVTPYGVYRLEEAGTNRLKSVEVLLWEDLTILDDVPMGEVTALVYNDDGDIVFVDGTSMLLRKIDLR